MKKIVAKNLKVTLSLLCFTVLCIQLSSQEVNQGIQPNLEVKHPSAYIVLGSGINNTTGLLGLGIDVKIVEQVSGMFMLGLGSWGTKLSAGAKFFRKYPVGVAYQASFSHSRGVSDIEMDVQVIDKNGSEVNQKVDMDLNPVNNLNLGVGYYWKLGRNSRFNLDLGYSLPLTALSDSYKIKTKDVQLTSMQKSFFGIMQPGGLLLGIGFSFGF
jgi:hypothetical protein